jgi:glycosyltransferase involved in cell wall biosynthesis
VLLVGRFVEKKGLHLIERLARRRSDLTFALAGWGPIDPGAWRLPNVHVFGNLQGASLVPLYQASDVLILPSVGEGLPLVLQEALACGLPVICGQETATADPDAGALIEGVKIEGADPDETVTALSARIDWILAGLTEQTSTAAAHARYAYALSRYSWTEAAQVYLSIMTALVRPTLLPAEAEGSANR